MSTKIVPMSEDAVINMLKTLPEDVLIDIFWKTLVESDVSPLIEEEKRTGKSERRICKRGNN